MRLYHYTGSEHVVDIQRQGISEGGLNLRGTIVNGYQWLTDDPGWSQAWATMRLVHCDRTEYRFAVSIPKSARMRLFRWFDFVEVARIPAPMVEDLMREGGGPEAAQHWYIFVGRIHPSWLRGLETRPEGMVERARATA